MPTWLRVAAGSRPRSRSSALARIERCQAPSGSCPARPALGRPGLDLGQRARVDREQLVHRRPEFRAQLLVAVEAVATAGQRLVVGDVAGRLLEVGGEATALQQLGEDVGDPLAGDVGAADLGDRVVAVADEDALVQLRRPRSLLVVEGTAGGRGVAGELLQVEPPHRPGIARIAGKKGAFHGFRQVHQGEDRTVQVGEMRGQERLLLGGELLDWIAHRGIVVTAGDAARFPTYIAGIADSPTNFR